MDLSSVSEAARALGSLGPAVMITPVCVRGFCVLVRQLANVAKVKIQTDAATKQLEMILKARHDERHMILAAGDQVHLPDALAALGTIELDVLGTASTRTDRHAGTCVEGREPLRSLPSVDEPHRRRARRSQEQGRSRDRPAEA